MLLQAQKELLRFSDTGISVLGESSLVGPPALLVGGDHLQASPRATDESEHSFSDVFNSVSSLVTLGSFVSFN